MSITLPLVQGSEMQPMHEQLREMEGRIASRKCCIQTNSSVFFPLTILFSGVGLLGSCCVYCVSHPCCPSLSQRIEKGWRGDHKTEDRIDLVCKAFDPDFTWCTNPYPRRSDATYFLTAPERQQMQQLQKALRLPLEKTYSGSDSSDSDLDG